MSFLLQEIKPLVHIYIYIERERERERERKIDFKELGHMIVEPNRSVIYKAFWQAGNPGRSCCSLEFKGSLEQNLSSLRDHSPFSEDFI